LNKAAIDILKSKYESMVKADLGYIIMILNADVEPMGKVIAGDGGTFHRVTFDALTFYPKLQEIIYGELVDITDFGAFVRIGPTDALLHLSQVMDDYLKSNIASGVILANQSGRTLKIGSTIRTRITAVSLGKASTMGKIGITCRQEHQMMMKIANNKDLQLIGINYKDTRADSVRYLEVMGNPFDVIVFDPSGKIGLDLGVYATPETFG